MELGTFGAVLSHALALEGELRARYLARADLAAEGERGASACRKRQQLLERVRREHVTEMILEPIHGLQGASYTLGCALSANASREEALRDLRAAEHVLARYYTDAAPQISIPEVKRILQRLARELAALG